MSLVRRGLNRKIEKTENRKSGILKPAPGLWHFSEVSFQVSESFNSQKFARTPLGRNFVLFEDPSHVVRYEDGVQSGSEGGVDV